MRMIDFYPTRGAFRPGQPARLCLEIEASQPEAGLVHFSILHLQDEVYRQAMPITLQSGLNRIHYEWLPPAVARRGYAAVVRVAEIAGTESGGPASYTAFDVLDDWTQYPRYGFLTDFAPGRAGLAESVATLAKYHINGLQFYDWQYRHDHLTPPDDEFTDPLGRGLSLVTIREAIAQSHAAGMAAMPYLAVYAASLEFWNEHPEWALYDANGQAHTFAGFLGLVDPTPGGPWITHLQAECARCLAALPFDGLHVDQYGEPKTAFNARGEAVDLPAAFAGLVGDLKAAHPGQAVVFNAVGNWPIEALVRSAVDFIYIEVWPPASGYADLLEIVLQARLQSGGKPVVIALYIAAERAVNICLANALILAAGGTRIELGEAERLLSDPYFPKHTALPEGLKASLRRYADFAVRYGEWLGPASRNLPGLDVRLPAGVWALARQSGDWLVISLVNFSGLGQQPLWDQPQPQPAALQDVAVSLEVTQPVRAVFTASPDDRDPGLQPAKWQQQGNQMTLRLPRLEYWSLIAIHTPSQILP